MITCYDQVLYSAKESSIINIVVESWVFYLPRRVKKYISLLNWSVFPEWGPPWGHTIKGDFSMPTL